MDKYPHYTIGELCNIEKGLTGIANAIPGEYPLVNTSAERKSCNTYQFDTEAVCIPLVSSTGHGKKTLNYVHYQKGKFALGTILAAVIPKEPKMLSAAFLHRYLQFNKDRKIVPLMKGAANVSLAVKDIAKIEIPVPPINEQTSFIELFNKLNNSSIKLQNEFSNQSSLLSMLRQAILQEAIEGKLTESWRKKNPIRKGDPEYDTAALLEKINTEKQGMIAEGKIRKEKPLAPIRPEEVPFELPDGWVWTRLGEVCSKIGSGSTPKGSNYSSKGFPFFRSQNIYDNGLIYDDIKYINDKVHQQMNGTVVLSNDLLLNITGGSLGRCSLVPEDFTEGNVSQHVCIVRSIFSFPKYFHYLILSPQFQKYVFNSTTGAGREGLPKYNLELFIIPLPPLAEQNFIIERADKLLAMVNELENQVIERKGQAEFLMQAVLREAFESN
jgi:type I restriction enzyme S subunit